MFFYLLSLLLYQLSKKTVKDISLSLSLSPHLNTRSPSLSLSPSVFSHTGSHVKMNMDAKLFFLFISPLSLLLTFLVLLFLNFVSFCPSVSISVCVFYIYSFFVLSFSIRSALILCKCKYLLFVYLSARLNIIVALCQSPPSVCPPYTLLLYVNLFFSLFCPYFSPYVYF